MPATSPSLTALASVFTRIGNFTFGGGAATTAALQREMVGRRRWLDNAQYALCYALARITPGTNLLAFCTASGWLLRGWRGALIALLAASVPACALVWFVTAVFDFWSGNRWVQIAIAGALAASVGILLAGFWLLVGPQMTRANWLRSAAVVLLAVALSVGAGLSPVLVLAISAVVGFFWQEHPEP
ncbi:MAG: chromate transporter [Bryobacterales bacterium]|nr:chromate transporter [Bryobacterales bacterium]